MKPNTFLRLFVAAKRSRTVGQAKGRLRCKPMIELLEDRLAPAAFMVNSTLDTDDGLGLGAVTTLRKAIRLANVDAVADTINFDPALANQTIILGGTALPISQPLTITGLGSDMLTINANNASRIFIINDGTAADIAVSISGLRLTGGNTDSGGAIFNTEALTLAACALDHNAADHFGGAVYNSRALNLTNSTLTSNSASNGGGGIANLNNGTLTLTNSTFSANVGSGGASDGGAIYAANGTVSVTDSTLSGNTARGGGGVYILNGTLTVTHSTFSKNTASSSGGGIFNSAATLTLTTATLSGNGAGNAGGGIRNDSGPVTLTISTLSGNSALTGAGIYNNTGLLALTSSTLSANITAAGGDGGGIYDSNGPLTLTNSTLSGNSARGGGGVYILNSTLTVTHSTFSKNTASSSGGGIFNSAATLTLTTATLSGNGAGNAGGGIRNDSGPVTLTNSTLSGNSALLGAGIYNNIGSLSLTSSSLSANSASNAGGGIYNSLGNAGVSNSILSANLATNNGGGIYNNGWLTVSNSTLSSNEVVHGAGLGRGGGIFNSGGTVTVANSTLSSNRAEGNPGGAGGGICNFFGTVTVANSTLSSNFAEGNGGGIYNSAILTLTNSILSGNQAVFGGGIYNDFSLMITVTNSTLTGNYAEINGGGIDINSGALTLTNSTLSANAAAQSGGAVFNSDKLTITNSTLTANSVHMDGGCIWSSGTLFMTNSTVCANSAADSGGGVFVNGGTAIVTNCTIVSNLADSNQAFQTDGGGVFGRATLFNSIVVGNSDGFLYESDLSDLGPVASASAFNLIGKGDNHATGGLANGINGNIIITNVALADVLEPTLRNNGGPTLTYALIHNSPAIDAGDATKVAGLFLFDQRGAGFNRIAGASVDIGAFEMPRPLFTDGFQRPQAPSLGTPWINQAGAFAIVGSMAKQAIGTGALNVATLGGAAAADLDLYVSVSLGANQSAGLVARYLGAGDKNYYLASLTSDADGNIVARLVRNQNGVVTELAVVEGVATGTGELHFRLVGSTLQLFLDGFLLATAEDTTFQSGSIGIRATATTALNNFQASPVSTGVGISDSFAYPDYTTLSDPWTQPVGFFRALGSQVQGGQAVNLAILNAVHQSDIDVQAFVSITGLNHTAGLLARYQGAGNTNFYLGKLSRTNTGFSAALIKNVAGVVTMLATANITSTTGKANLRFLVTGTSLNLFVNNILVVNAFDTSLATGSVGIRADAYTRLDDFRASAVTTDVPFSDNFNQPDNSGLTIQWTRRAGDFKVAAKTAVAASPTALSLATLVGVQQANVNVKADVTLTTSGDEVGLLASYAGPGDANYYLARVLKTTAGFNLSIVTNVGGTVTTLTSADVAALTGTISFRIQGTSLLLFMNNVQQLSATDSSLTAGSVGIRSVGTGAIDNFAVTKTAFLPFNDAFPSASGPNLSGNWTTRAGGYTTAAASAVDTAKGTAALNLATLGRFDMSDVAVQADISVSNTAGEFASLAARYSGAGDLNMYLATVAWDGTQFVASISKRLNGVTTQLASTAIGSGAGTLRFTVVGSQLTLSFGGVDLLSTWDFALQSGSVGIRSSLGSTFDNFSANQAT